MAHWVRWPVLPSWPLLLTVLLLSWPLWWRPRRLWLLALVAATLGLAYAAWRAELRLAQRLDAALAAYRESLEIRQRLRQTLGDTPQVITGLAIGLRRLLALNAGTTQAERAAWQLALNQLPKMPG